MSTRTTTVTISHCTTVGPADPLAALQLAHACGAPIEWVAELAEVGILRPQSARLEDWRFDGGDLRRALDTRRLQRDFDVGLDAAALILELQQEVRRLRALLG
jgi:chaperone modulatory protein CbpM